MGCNHHKKLNTEIPAWLWFSIFPMGIKFTPEEEKKGAELALTIKGKLKEFLKLHDIEDDIITEPNKHDALSICDQCIGRHRLAL